MRRPLADALAHPPERFDVAELRRPAEAVLARDPLAVEPHRLADELGRRAELRERRPVARHLERRREPRVPGVGDVGRADQPRVVGQQDRESGLGDDGLPRRRQVEAEPSVEGRVDRQERNVAGGVDLIDHHHPALAHRLHERGVDQRYLRRRSRRPGRSRSGRRTRRTTDRAAARRTRRTGRRAARRHRGPGRSTGGRRSRGRSGSCPAPGGPISRRNVDFAGSSMSRSASASSSTGAPCRQGGYIRLPSGSRIGSPGVASSSAAVGSGTRSPSAATPSICDKAAVIALMRFSFSEVGQTCTSARHTTGARVVRC